jgi:hypothetical protein
MKAVAIYCADIGSVQRGNFGWARACGDEPAPALRHRSDINSLCDAVVRDLTCHVPVALGFECPLFVPITPDARFLTCARPGEGNRAWCAGGGAGALATGLTETVWILDRIKKAAPPSSRAFLIWKEFVVAASGLFLWEAFVTSKAKRGAHHDDAEAAVTCFRSCLPDVDAHNAVTGDRVRSLIGAALLQAGWSSDLALLHATCLVIRASAASGAL